MTDWMYLLIVLLAALVIVCLYLLWKYLDYRREVRDRAHYQQSIHRALGKMSGRNNNQRR